MRHFNFRLFVVLFAIIVFPFKHNSQNSDFSIITNSTITKAVVDSLSRQILKYYVFKPEAQKMSEFIKLQLSLGKYSTITNPHLLAAQLTDDVRNVHLDEHFHVEFNPKIAHEISGDVEDIPKMVADKLEEDRAKNFGFKKIEFLNGNIAFLEISSFARLNKFSKQAADAALNFVSNANALIIDLRYGVGGSPEMVNYIVSHFFKSKTRTIDIEIRSENTTLNYATTPDSSQTKLHNIPIFILTSYKTFSAAEGLAFELQYLKRATIVGETTRGGAHTVTYRPLSNGFVADIPFGRAITPDTKKNWERVGVVPDIKETSDNALNKAVTTFFNQQQAKLTDELAIKKSLWQQQIFQAKQSSFEMDTTLVKSIVGNYGSYKITWVNNKLYSQKSGKPNFELTQFSKNAFIPKGNDTFIVNFLQKPEVSLTVNYEDGHTETVSKLK